MTRETWVYPDDGPPYRKGEQPERLRGGVTILPDLPDFVSPIDGKTYSGRAGLRDHCARHNVVPTSDLKGLPPLPGTGDTRSPEQKRADADHRKRLIINQVNKHYR
jgi:hypothetical protein